MFVDDYRLDEKWEKYISNKNFSIVSFDDTNLSNHYSDYLINYDPQYIDKSKFDFKKNKKKKNLHFCLDLNIVFYPIILTILR